MLDRKQEIARQIKEAMEAAGLGRKQLADKMGKNPSEITRWLSGKHNFTVDLLSQISEVLGVEIVGVRPSELVAGYSSSDRMDILRDSACPAYTVPSVVLPPANFHNLCLKARRKGMSLASYVQEILLEDSSHMSSSLQDFCGILPDGFPAAEDIRGDFHFDLKGDLL